MLFEIQVCQSCQCCSSSLYFESESEAQKTYDYLLKQQASYDGDRKEETVATDSFGCYILMYELADADITWDLLSENREKIARDWVASYKKLPQ